MSIDGKGQHDEIINSSFSSRSKRRNIECTKVNVVLIAALVVAVIVVVGLVPVYINASNASATRTATSQTITTINQTTTIEHTSEEIIEEPMMSENMETMATMAPMTSKMLLQKHRMEAELNISKWKMEIGTSLTIVQTTEPAFIMQEVVHKLASLNCVNLIELKNNVSSQMLFHELIHDICPEMTSCSNQVSSSPYSTIDGSCNNLMHADWGMSTTPYRRDLSPDYADGIGSPRIYSVDGSMLPSPRTISNMIHRPIGRRQDDLNATVMTMSFGQFLSHDIVSTPSSVSQHRSPLDCCSEPEPLSGPFKSCFNIEIEPNDEFFGNISCMSFTRSAPAPCKNCDICAREQVNDASSYIDASNVYGSTLERMRSVRKFRRGLMLINEDNDMLPWKPGTASSCPMSDGKFAAGDARVNVVPNLSVTHLLFVRFHNHVASKIRRLNKHWSDDELFFTTRKIVIAVMQKVVYGDYLPIVLGPETMTRYDLGLADDFRLVYNRNTNAAASNAFATAAFRFGHSTIPEAQCTFDENYKFERMRFIEDTFNKVEATVADSSSLARWMVRHDGVKSDGLFSKGVRDLLFFDRASFASEDLAAMNIQRGRDHGIPSYNRWRQFCQLPVITQLEFDQLGTAMGDFEPMVADKYRRVYRHPDDIDLFSGGMMERLLRDSSVGPTFACILGDNFSRLKTGDRFYFENPFQLTGFNVDQLMSIKNITFAKVVCETMQITRLSEDVFNPSRGLDVQCEDLADIDYTLWTDD
ncbi:hypothetical protein ACF0H5_024448 [Mactra antiquata]